MSLQNSRSTKVQLELEMEKKKKCFPSVACYIPAGVITLLWLFNYLVVHCPELKPPENGYFVQNVCNNYFNAACGIRCKAGFDLVGSSIRLCQPNGQWSGSEATCRGMDVCLKSHFLLGSLVLKSDLL